MLKTIASEDGTRPADRRGALVTAGPWAWLRRGVGPAWCLSMTALYTRVAIEDLRQLIARAHPRR